MRFSYINNFDNLHLIQKISSGNRGGALGPIYELGAVPSYDPLTSLPPFRWGPMWVGASTTPSLGTFVVEPPVNQTVGVTVTLKNNPSNA